MVNYSDYRSPVALFVHLYLQLNLNALNLHGFVSIPIQYDQDSHNYSVYESVKNSSNLNHHAKALIFH